MRYAIADALVRFAGRTALSTEEGGAWSYERLGREAQLISKAVPPASLVIIEGGNCPATVAAYLAVLLSGGVAHLCLPGTANTLRRDFGPLVVIKCEGYVASVEVDVGIENAAPIDPNLVLLFTTSGSTGRSKLVKITAGNILSNTLSIIQYLGLSVDDRAITSLKPSYTFGLSVINAQLLSGGALLLTDRPVQDSAFWIFARDQRATLLSGVPHTYEVLAEDRVLEATPSLRILTQAGGKLRPDLVRAYAQRGRRANWRFYVMYGQTEASPRMAYLPPELAESAAEAIGIAVPGGMLSIEDESGRVIEQAGVEGELIYRGPNVMAGYALSREDLADAKAGDRLATGDLAVRREDGLYVITGRRSRFVKPLGKRVGLDDVETLLAGRGVAAAVVAKGEGLLIAYEGEMPTDVSNLAVEIGVPVSYVSLLKVEELPRLVSGKIDYLTVRALGDGSPLWLPAHFPRFLGNTITEAWRILTGRDAARDILSVFTETFRCPVTNQDSFRDLGGDSLTYVELSIALEDFLGPLPDRWIHMSVAELERWRSEAL